MDKKNDQEIDKLIEENPNSERLPKKAKIILGIIIPITILLVIALIIVIIYYQKKLSDKGDDIKPDPTPTPTPFPDVDTYSFFGDTLYNLTYDDDGKIENSFKIDGYNHIEGVDSINDNKDYEKNERNIYNLYIPQYAMDRKNDFNGILLWVHGGAWTTLFKEMMDLFCKLISIQGYISATLGYTLLTPEFKEFNIFKNLDEITACIKAIKNN